MGRDGSGRGLCGRRRRHGSDRRGGRGGGPGPARPGSDRPGGGRPGPPRGGAAPTRRRPTVDGDGWDASRRRGPAAMARTPGRTGRSDSTRPNLRIARRPGSRRGPDASRTAAEASPSGVVRPTLTIDGHGDVRGGPHLPRRSSHEATTGTKAVVRADRLARPTGLQARAEAGGLDGACRPGWPGCGTVRPGRTSTSTSTTGLEAGGASATNRPCPSSPHAQRHEGDGRIDIDEGDELEDDFAPSVSHVPRRSSGVAGRDAGAVIDGSSFILIARAWAPIGERWARRKRRVVVVPLSAPARGANDRVPRFSRLRWADSVRFVRFDMT